MIRIGALLVAILGAGMAVHVGIETRRFLRAAHPGVARVLAANQTGTTIRIETMPGPAGLQIRLEARPDAVPGNTLPILYVTRSDGTLDVRSGPERAIRKRVWVWIETVLAAVLVAVYARALLEDPLSIIGFKSWRSLRR